MCDNPAERAPLLCQCPRFPCTGRIDAVDNTGEPDKKYDKVEKRKQWYDPPLPAIVAPHIRKIPQKTDRREIVHISADRIQPEQNRGRKQHRLSGISDKGQADQRQIPDNTWKCKRVVIHQRLDRHIRKHLVRAHLFSAEHLRYFQTAALPALPLCVQLVCVFDRIDKKDGFFTHIDPFAL